MMDREIMDMYRDAAGDRPDAIAFLFSFHAYAHMVDDLVDEGCTPDALMEMLAVANSMYASPFWIANSARLSGVLNVVGNTYLDSVHWEKSRDDSKRHVADVIRLCGNDVVIAVAQIVGGWKHGRRISERLREFAWENQHKVEVKHG
jgi:hypothetical protein